MTWIFQPCEAYDAVVFCNAMSTTEHYARHYPGLRSEWSSRLGEAGLRQVDDVHQSISMSRLCYWLEYLKPNTLDDLLSLFTTGLQDAQTTIRSPESTTSPESTASLENTASLESTASRAVSDAIENLLAHRENLLALFRRLKLAGFDTHWREWILPALEDSARRLLQNASKHDLSQVRSTLQQFVGVPDIQLTTHVYITYYTKPIAFQLPGGAMVCNADHLPTPETVLRLAIHESIHGFPGSQEAQREQDKLRRNNPLFDAHYHTLMDKFHSGPEEYFVVGAEAYLTERLRLRTSEECSAYLLHQNGGMPFALEIYKLLRETTPDNEPTWRGYGAWLTEQMRQGRLSP
ncbi:MAG: hypothetical protein K6T83_01850 [Alicyclobacillus sp.]|nr:hypothetical protein [Alicyclobacillus sp.]